MFEPIFNFSKENSNLIIQISKYKDIYKVCSIFEFGDFLNSSSSSSTGSK